MSKFKHFTKQELEDIRKVRIEVHADGVKEIPEECPFCEVPCNEPHCAYTEEE
jgi:hypothetical protein